MKEQDLNRRSLLARSLALPGVFFAARAAAASDRDACVPTESDYKGPMYLAGAPRRAVLAGPKEPGQRIRIRGTVFAADCKTPLPRTLLDVWQCDANGQYHWQDDDYRLRGQLFTNARGEFEIETIRPAPYGGRPAHIHFTISAPEHPPLTTQLYFKGDPALSHDLCGPACNSDDPHRIVEFAKSGGEAVGRFDVVLKAARG